jgi:uncharacterized protein
MNTFVSIAQQVDVPSDETVRDALNLFAKDVRAHYGPSVAGVYLYGSRARGDHSPESDVDIAVVLSPDFDYWREAGVLSDLAYDYLLDRGVLIEPKPLSLKAWSDPSSHVNPSVVLAMRRDCKEIGPGN